MDDGLLVLDTNVVLDWFLFADERVAALAQAIVDGHRRWVSCTRMRDEFERTLLKPALQRRVPDISALLARYDLYATACKPPPKRLNLVCDDPDDQVFIDLAFAEKAGWIISHDKALLRLQRRAAPCGLRIVKPGAWGTRSE